MTIELIFLPCFLNEGNPRFTRGYLCWIDDYFIIHIPLPPVDEHEKIVRIVDEKFRELYKLKEKILVQIQKLKEYRQSLISAAVTGNIDFWPASSGASVEKDEISELAE